MPDVLTLPRPAPHAVLACGAFLKNTAGRLDGARWRASDEHGDLGTPEACIALDEALATLRAAGPVAAVAHDLHPDFHSTRLALALADELDVPALGVQHHHAHIAAVAAEHGLAGPVIGLALDGVGLGTDGTAWGGEVLWVHGAQMNRLDHLPSLALPGGDVAAREPWRLAAAALQALGRGDEIVPRLGPAVGERAAATVATMLARGLNCPASTGAGRWFDAAAGLLGLSTVQAHEAEAAIALERAATAYLEQHPGFDAAQTTLDLWPVLAELPALAAQGPEGQARGAALFHAALANGLAAVAVAAAASHGVRNIALGGGCFFNRVLSQRLAARLAAAGLTVWRPQALSCGDAGLALGQAWVAAHALHNEPAPET